MANVIKLHTSNDILAQDTRCKFAPSCALHTSTSNIEEEISATIYHLITNRGRIVRGIQGVKPAHARALLEAVEALSFDLHEFLRRSESSRQPMA